MLPIKKIYIDSRHATDDSKDSSNFKIELPDSYKMPSDTVFFITDVCIPHTWLTVEENINDRIYFMISNSGGPYTYYIATMQAGNYDGPAFRTALNNAIYSVNQGVSVTFNNNVLIIGVSGMGVGIKVLTDKEIQRINTQMNQTGISWNGGTYNGGFTSSCNDNIANHTPLPFDTRYVCNFLNLQYINNVYITSPNLGSFDTISPFSNNVIRKIPVNANYGYMIFDSGSTTNDFLNCSNLTLKTLEFHIKDSRGNYINLHDSHVTFSVVFNKFNVNQ